MTRLAFAMAVPLAAIVLGAVVAIDLVGLGFAAEGCRSHDGSSVRWGAVGEAAVLQLLFGVAFALALAVLAGVIRRRFAAFGRAHGRAMETFAIVGFLLLSLGQVIAQAGCSLEPYHSIAKVFTVAATVALGVAAVLLAITYGRGLTGGTR